MYVRMYVCIYVYIYTFTYIRGAGGSILSVIKDMYEDGDPVTRQAIAQAWANVRPRPHITPQQQPTVKSQEVVREELVREEVVQEELVRKELVGEAVGGTASRLQLRLGIVGEVLGIKAATEARTSSSSIRTHLHMS
jgi:hypothetical protein